MILQLERRSPPLWQNERDIDCATGRSSLRPDMISISTTDIAGKSLGMQSGLFFGHLEMPFGRVASPAYFKLHTEAIASLRSHFRPNGDLMRGAARCNSSIYVDDCTMVEFPAGQRMGARTAFWEWRRRQILDDDSVNLDGGNSRAIGHDVIPCWVLKSTHGETNRETPCSEDSATPYIEPQS